MAGLGGSMAHDHFGDAIRDKFFEFLETFTTANAAYSMSQASAATAGEETQQYYIEQLKAMRGSEKTTLFVDWQHLVSVDADLADELELQYLRVDPFLRKAVQHLVRKYQENYVESEESGEREFWVAFYNLPKKLALRGLKTQQIGRLVEWEGTVTRTSEVRPELYLGTFECLQCHATVPNVEQQYKYTEPLICPETSCGNRKHWLLRRDRSTFVDWQRVKVQELSEQVPPGSLPRTMDVIMRNDVVESVRAGDKMVFTGSLVVVPDISAVTAPGERVETRFGGTANKGASATDSAVTGLKALGVRELTYKLCFMACSTSAREQQAGVVNIRSDDDLEPDELLGQFSSRDAEKVLHMKADPQIYERLAKSIAPGVYGHENVKRAILLMLFGGVHKQTAEGINLRGDINVAIVGDPSCAKSQLLKYVAGFLPRAVYTSGKSSSAAGLTATVVKESDTNEFCIEAGALMLADNGICCIDEFDKMDVKDQVAIHEAMEQQTISIAKAGIQATLNARTSILAAANPVGGRYDRSKPLKYNVALPPAILSRFDMMHVMVDEPDAVEDRMIASHIVDVHRQRDALTFDRVPYKMDDMQRYIKYARAIKPELTDHAAAVLVEQYKRLRADDAAPGSATAYRITVRQLEALVRLSEALARVHCSETILPSYVREATRLVKNSLIAIEQTDVDVDDPEAAAEEDALAAAAEARRSDGDAAHADDAGPAPMDTDGPSAAAGEGRPPSQTRPSPAAESQPAPSDTGAQRATGGGPLTARTNQQQQQQQAPGTKVTRKKFEHVKNLLVMKLREREAESQGIVEFGANEVAGMTQHDLVTWYFDFQAERNEELGEMRLEGSMMAEEARVVQLIVAHLIAKENVLVVVEQPEQEEGEADEAFRMRRMRERVLAISPNYTEA